MKRLLCLVMVFLVSTAFVAVANEEAEVYRQIYKDAQTLQQKYAAALNLIQLQDREIAPILSEALADLLRTQNNYVEASDKELFGRTVKMLATALGDDKYDDAAPSLWGVVQQVSDPLARSEALIALGKIRALDYAERIALLLRNLDIAPGPDRDSDEKTAYGCILALEKLKDPRGFMPVFYAVDSWYTLRVRQQADRSLPNIVADPTDLIMDLIRTESADRKLYALKESTISQAPADRKITADLLALSVGQATLPRDRTEAKVLADLRKLAFRSLITLKATIEDEVDPAVTSYNSGFDDEERLLALQALGVNAGDKAAAALRDILLKLDSDQKSGIADETRNRMAKAAIENAAATQNHMVRAALIAVASDDKWSNSIIYAAQNAAKGIQ